MDINKSLCKHDLDSSNHPKVASQGQSKWFDNCKICLPYYLIHFSRQYKIFSSELQGCVKKKGLLKEIFLPKSGQFHLSPKKGMFLQLKISNEK